MPGPTSDAYQPPDDHAVYCAFCGHTYPPGTPTSKAEALAEHIRQCPEHPVGKELRDAQAELDRLQSKLGRTADGAYVGIGDSLYTTIDFHGLPMKDAVEGVAWGDDDPGERKWYRAEFWLPADRSDITIEVHRPLSEAWSTPEAALAAARDMQGRLIEEIPGFPPEVRSALARLDPPVTTVGELFDWQRQHGDDWPERIPDVGTKARRDAHQAVGEYINR